MDALPIWLVFALCIAFVVLAVEIGFRLGYAVRRRSEKEKESPVSAISGTNLGLLAFIRAFTFALVTDRYHARRELVRDEANALRNAFSRSDILPQPDRVEAKELLKKYLDLRVHAVEVWSFTQLPAAIAESDRIQQRLWDMAMTNARNGANSDVDALYYESLNDVANVHATRLTLALQARIPAIIWGALASLMALGMMGLGYQVAIAGSHRTWSIIILTVSFSLVITLIAELDRPSSGYLTITQKPLIDLQAWMAARQAKP